jgi:hypothetical protein
MQPRTWRRLDTIAHRMGVTLEEATEIADDCARRQWADHELHSVRLREGGRRVAVVSARPSFRNNSRQRLSQARQSGIRDSLADSK